MTGLTRGKRVTWPSAGPAAQSSPLGTAHCSRPGGDRSIPVPGLVAPWGGLGDLNLRERLCRGALSPLPWKQPGHQVWGGSHSGDPSLPNALPCFASQPGAAGLTHGLPGQQQPGPMCKRDCAECHQGEQEEGCGAGGGGGPGFWERSGEQEKVISQQSRSLPTCWEGHK